MSASVTPPKRSKQLRRDAMIPGIVTVVVLAAILIGIAAFGPAQSEKKVELGLADTALDSEQYAVQAENALASGNTTAAVELANRALSIDPDNATARSVIVGAASSQQNATSSGASSSKSTPRVDSKKTSGAKPVSPDPDVGFTKKLSDMERLLPIAFEDYFLGGATTTENESQVSATPVSVGQEANQVIWTVHQTNSKAEARAFISDVSKNLYANDVATLKFDGVTAYFGTDGARFATVSYLRGIYVFEVLVTGTDTNPKTLQGLAQEAAKAFADAPPK